jgi:hypothetical protein
MPILLGSYVQKSGKGLHSYPGKSISDLEIIESLRGGEKIGFTADKARDNIEFDLGNMV